MPDCLNCTENCPQAERAHETAKGRMYATQELVELVKKIESGQLIEVVRCGECKSFGRHSHGRYGFCSHPHGLMSPKPDQFCSYGERRTDGNL